LIENELSLNFLCEFKSIETKERFRKGVFIVNESYPEIKRYGFSGQHRSVPIELKSANIL